MRAITITAVVAGCIVLLAGCGGSSQPPAATPAPASPPVVQEQPKEPVVGATAPEGQFNFATTSPNDTPANAFERTGEQPAGEAGDTKEAPAKSAQVPGSHMTVLLRAMTEPLGSVMQANMGAMMSSGRRPRPASTEPKSAPAEAPAPAEAATSPEVSAEPPSAP